MNSFIPSKIRSTSISIVFLMGVASLSLWSVEGHAAATLPELPMSYIDTTYSPPTGATCTAANSSAFQTCLNNAALNSTIVLQAGTTYTGPFTLPNKTSGSGWIYIVSSNLTNLPAPGNRVGPADASNMPKIQAGPNSADRAVLTVNNSHHYRFVGIEFKPQTGKFNTVLIYLDGGGISDPNLLPNNFIIDRCYIHGDPTAGGRRGIFLNAASVAVIDSYLSDFKESNNDSQAIMSANSPGPIKIVNNYLEAASENVMFGGQDPSITNLVPADIEIRQNYFFKPLSWRSSSWSVKNLLEFKNAKRILIEGNVFENSWSADQDGTAILITPKNQNNTAPWTTTEDITIRYNQIKNANVGVRMCGSNCDQTETETQNRVHIHDNAIEVNTALGYSNTALFSLLKDVTNLTINHNTGFVLGSGSSRLMIQNSGNPHPDYLDFRNNIVSNGMYGWKADGIGGGTTSIEAYFDNYEFLNNAIIGASSGGYPDSTYYPANISAVGFVDYSGGNYRLSASSPYKNAGTDGKDLGADIDAIEAAIAGSAGLKEDIKILPPTELTVEE